MGPDENWDSRLKANAITIENFVRGVTVMDVDDSKYPFDIPAVAQIDKIIFDNPVTFFVGENGSGKSTIIESVAVAAGFGNEGGSKNSLFSTYDSTSKLHEHIKLTRGARREKDGYFLRAESFYNVASYMEEPNPEGPLRYGGKSMHEQSHGESFMWLVTHRFNGNSLLLLDEPEAALSPQRQLALLVAMHDLVEKGSQFIIATHSPILLAYPGATIYHLDESGIEKVNYDEIEHVQLSRDFLNNPTQYLSRLFTK